MKGANLFKVRLETRAPLFIGSGLVYKKKEFIHNPRNNVVIVIDHNKLMEWLISKNNPELIDMYEKFMMGNDRLYLENFLGLKEIKDVMKEQQGLFLYRTDAGAAINITGTLSDIQVFMRDPYNRPYVPGSSLKGALRTVILTKMIRDDKRPLPLPDDISRKYSANNTEIHYLHRLTRHKNSANALNSIMSGLSVSDSLPIPQESMMLAKKIDRFRDGTDNPNQLNVVRECVKPGVEIAFSLTLDPSICGPITEDFLRDAIREYGDYYKKTFCDKFPLPDNADQENFDDCILLGGGNGYFSKNIVYPGRDWQTALKRVSEMMSRKFRRHKHEKDIAIGVSPRTIKYTQAKNQNGAVRSYQFGVCRFSMDKVQAC